MRKYLPILALFLVYAAFNLSWQWRLTQHARAQQAEIERLRAEAVTQQQMRAWTDALAKFNNAVLVVPEF